MLSVEEERRGLPGESARFQTVSNGGVWWGREELLLTLGVRQRSRPGGTPQLSGSCLCEPFTSSWYLLEDVDPVKSSVAWFIKVLINAG